MHLVLPSSISQSPHKLSSFRKSLGSILIAWANFTRLWRSRKPQMGPLLAGLALVASVTLLSFPIHAQTFKALPLDCGGWFSGFAQADNGRLYGYGDVYGAWRSDNGGTSWSYLNWSIPGGDISGTAMAVQKNNADIVYYATPNALWKSTNGGTTWTALLSDLGDKTPRFRGSSPILVRSNDPNELWFAGPRKGMTGWLWKSIDGGENWVKAGGNNFDSNRARTLHNVTAYANQIWVGSDNGLYVSTDGGNNFRLVGGSGRLSDVGMIARFTTGSFAGGGLVTRSNNNGGGISRITATNYNDATTYSVSDAATANLYFGYPTGLQIFSDGSASAWNTSANRHGFSPAGNGGQTFTVRATTLKTDVVPIWATATEMATRNHPDYGTDQVIEAVGNPNKWIITGGFAPMYSLDKGLSWQYFPNGSGLAGVKTYLAGLSRYDANRVYVPGSDIGSVVVTDGGSSGQAAQGSYKSYNGLHGCFRVLEGPDTQNLVLAGVAQGDNTTVILKSANGGSTWTPVSQNDNGLPPSLDGITKSVMSFTDANDFLVVLASGTAKEGPIPPGSINPGVWRTTNGGASFRQVEDLPTTGLQTGFRYEPQSCFIERDAVQANVRYFISRGTAFYRSTNGGTNWTPRTHPFGVNVWAWGLHADPVRGENLWAAGDYAGVRVSRNGGQSWTPTAQYINARLVSSCDGKIAVFGSKAGDTQPRLYYSTDDGVTFNPLTTPTRNFHGVQGITVDRNGKVWVSWNSVTVVTPTTGAVTPTTIPVAPTTPLITARGEHQPNEGKEKAFDGNPDSKWLDFSATSWLQIQYPSAVAYNQYVLVSGNDAPERDPKSWTVQGSQDGNSWTTLDTQTNQAWSARKQAKTYRLSNTTPYAYYKLTITAANGASSLQLSELTYGNGPAVAGNLGFENDFASWSTYGTASVNTTAAHVHSGSKSGYFRNGGGNYTLTGLTVGATYSLRAWVKAETGADVWVTVSGHGGPQVGERIAATSWTQTGDIVFTMGAGSTTATLAAWTGSTSAAYFDDYAVTLYSGTGTSGRSASPLAQRPARQAGVEVFPNPARHSFTVVTDDDQARITVLSLDGRVMANGQQKTVACDTWSAGVYIVKVQTKTGLTIQKLVVAQ